MEAFERQDCQAAKRRENSMLLLYCCDPHYDLCFSTFTIPGLPYIIKLHGTCCHFSFLLIIRLSKHRQSSQSEGIVFIFSIARPFFLSWMALNICVSST